MRGLNVKKREHKESLVVEDPDAGAAEQTAPEESTRYIFTAAPTEVVNIRVPQDLKEALQGLGYGGPSQVFRDALAAVRVEELEAVLRASRRLVDARRAGHSSAISVRARVSDLQVAEDLYKRGKELRIAQLSMSKIAEGIFYHYWTANHG